MENQKDGVKTRVTINKIVIVIAVAFAVLIILLNIAPFGANVVYKTDFLEDTSKIDIKRPFATKTVLTENGEGNSYETSQLVMNTDIVEFALQVPYNTISTVDFKIKYKGDMDEFILGVYRPVEDKFIYRPIHNNTLNKVTWPKLTSGGLTLFQRENKYDSIDSFVEALPSFINNDAGQPGERITTYFYDLPQPKDPAINSDEVNDGAEVGSTLRGAHQFDVYVDGKPLEFEFEKWDLNSQSGEDLLDIKVYSQKQHGKLVFSKRIEDDGNVTQDNKPTGPDKIEVEVPGAEEDVFSVEFSCGHDVLIKNFSSTQKYMVFKDSVFLADHELYNLGPTKSATLFTEGSSLGFEIWHKEAVQAVVINDEQPVLLDTPNISEDVIVERPMELNKIDVPMAAISVKSNKNYFSFSRGSWFDPMPVKVSEFNKYFNTLNHDYIITSYTLPDVEQDYYKRNITLDVSSVDIIDKRVDFILYAPGLSEGGGEVQISNMEIVMRK